jgi:uncharacterized protein (DUF2147 family)
MIRGIVTTLLAAAALSSGMAAAQDTRGTWLTESGNLEVEIASCGAELCGTVVKVLADRSMADPGKQFADAKPAMGLKILHDFVPAATGELQGKIYNRENGKTYDCLLSLQSPDELKVRAYVGMPLFGKTQIWRRVSSSSSAK